MATTFTFKILIFYSGILLLLVSSVVAFIHRCRMAAKKGEMFFYLRFEETYDDKGRLDLVPIDTDVEGTEDYERVYEAYGFCFGMFFLFTLFTMVSLAWSENAGYPLPTFIPFSLMLATGLWIAPIFSLLILEANENDLLRIFILTTFGSFGCVFTGVTLAESSYMAILGLLLPLLFLPLLVYHLQSLLFWGIAIGTPWNVKPKVRKIMAYYGMFWFSSLLVYQGSLVTGIASADESNNTWTNAIEVAMVLFITTVELIFRFLEAFGNA
ncbi:MAG: hypothetical protein CMD98_01935 [Gammaproteobacteria bacterium]|nr:hypothetical protein [Gammaproteobacteria bacterium]